MSLLSKIFGASASKTDFQKLLQEGAKIVDVRSPGEFKSGRVNGSMNYPLGSLGEHIKGLKELNVPIILVCRSGGRAGSAKSILEKEGLECYNAGAWQNLA